MEHTTAWNPSLYTKKHSFVYEYGESLVELLAPQAGEKIIDVGCGSGELTHKISLSGADVTGIDASPEMVEQAQKNFPRLHFAVMDAAQLPFSEEFDAVFSNATLHWIFNQVALATRIYDGLVPDGRMVVEFGGKGNVQNIRHALRSTLLSFGYLEQANRSIWYFPSIGQYATLLEETGFQVQLAQHYDRDTALEDTENGMKDWLRMFAGAFLKGIPPAHHEDTLEQTQESLRSTQYRDGVWHADYKRIRMVAVKTRFS